MKLRIKGNSIRLRLTQDEVVRVENGHSIEECTQLSVTEQFRYRLEPWQLNTPDVRFEEGVLTVYLPSAWLDGWMDSEKVGFEQTIEKALVPPLHLLIEKDFACLAPRPGEDEANQFPNPQTGSAKC